MYKRKIMYVYRFIVYTQRIYYITYTYLYIHEIVVGLPNTTTSHVEANKNKNDSQCCQCQLKPCPDSVNNKFATHGRLISLSRSQCYCCCSLVYVALGSSNVRQFFPLLLNSYICSERTTSQCS